MMTTRPSAVCWRRNKHDRDTTAKKYIQGLLALEGKCADGGTNTVTFSDGDVDKWSEIDAPVLEDEDATEADYLAALNELGVSE